MLDQSISLSHVQQHAFDSAHKMYLNQQPVLQQGAGLFKTFSEELAARVRTSPAADAEPAEDAILQAEEGQALQKYWSFHETMVTAHEVMHTLKSVMTLLTPVPREAEQQSSLAAHYPEVNALLISVDAKAKELLGTLTAAHGAIEDIYKEMSGRMTGVQWDMKRLAGIVANNGAPLTSYQLATQFTYFSRAPEVRSLKAAEGVAGPSSSSSEQVA